MNLNPAIFAVNRLFLLFGLDELITLVKIRILDIIFFAYFIMGSEYCAESPAIEAVSKFSWQVFADSGSVWSVAVNY